MNISQVHMHAMQNVMLQYSIRAENMFGNINSNILPFLQLLSADNEKMCSCLTLTTKF